ncbi:MAG TPA: putative Ig domain-containing protein, partial [Opitutales bacterium]|nr:putative Ig domain-containing protein [Opitutales bacterium]
VEFDLPNEPVVNYANGNGVLESSTGLGVLEHLAFVPADGSGKYEIYLDDFEQVEDREIVFSLGSGAPAGASIDPETGFFSWTPSPEQGDQTHEFTILATTAGPHGQTVAETFFVTVRSVRQVPVLDEIADRTVHPGETVHFTATLFEPDSIPENLIFALDSTAPSGAQIDPVTGTFFWTSELSHVGKIFPVTIRAIDDGNPPLEGTVDFNIHVTEPLTIRTISANENEISLMWNGIEGAIYRLQTTTDLGQPWVDLSLDLVANESPMVVTIPVESDQPKRFFRIQTISRESPEP